MRARSWPRGNRAPMSGSPAALAWKASLSGGSTLWHTPGAMRRTHVPEAGAAELLGYLVAALLRPDRFRGARTMPTGTLILILYCAVTTGLAWLLAGCMHRVLTGTRVRPSPVLGPLERACLVAAGPAATRAQGWAGQGWAGHPAPPPSWCSTWRASSCCTRSCGRRAGCPGPPPGASADVGGSRLRHGGGLCRQHRLAGPFWRGAAVPPAPDGRADRAELRLGGDRDGGGRGRDPGASWPTAAGGSGTSGPTWCGRSFTC